jgi:glycosyltransferase involved in cell wall biosynthesis
MKILIINSEYPPIGGGAGNASANIARCLAALNHDVTVLTTRFNDHPKTETCSNGLTIHRVNALRSRQDRSNALEQIAFILSASFWTLGWVRRNKPNATLAFFGMPSGAVAWLLKKIHHIPYIISLRGGDVPGFRPYDFKIMHKLIGPILHVIWHDASAVIANSNGLRDQPQHLTPALIFPSFPMAWMESNTPLKSTSGHRPASSPLDALSTKKDWISVCAH